MRFVYGDKVRIKATGAVGTIKHTDTKDGKDWYGVVSKGERTTHSANELEPVEKSSKKVVDKWFN